MAQQSLQQQTDRQLIEVILANVGNIVVFRTGSTADARLLLPIFSPFIKIHDLLNLNSYRFYAKLQGIQVYPPLSGITRLAVD